MSTQAHTPLPWKWHWRSEDEIATGSIFAEPREGHAYAVAMTPRYQTKERWEADAALIAHAVNSHAVMLDTLKMIAAGLADTGSTPGQHMTKITKMEACVIAHAAIAKAEGP